MEVEMKKVVTPLLAGLFLVATAALAGNDGKALTATDATAFQAQRQEISRELADGKTYSELDQKQRDEVLAALNRIDGALAEKGNVESMPEEMKLRVFNDQELVNTILTKGREDSRLFCTRETPSGSHRARTSCKTVAERRREHERSQDALRSVQRPTGLDPSH
jgi:hypothetical protein